MGKKQHSKDQLYITQTEWKSGEHRGGGKRNESHLPYKVLPFDCCAISFRPFEGSPMCTADGSVFDLMNIVPYLKKYRRHPVTGGPLTASELFKLTYHKNTDGHYHCPVLFKAFNMHSHIVAIKTTGNVYSYEAIKELNLKARNLRDLIDNTAFTRDDLITIQDPNNATKRELTSFSHVTEKLSAKKAQVINDIRQTDATSRILSQLVGAPKEAGSSSTALAAKAGKGLAGMAAAKTAAAGVPTVAAPMKGRNCDAVPKQAGRWLQTTGQHSAGFTSTMVTPTTTNQIAELSKEEASRQRYAFLKKKKKKGYCQLQTSHGNLNLELHVDVVPMTCENFVGLCDRGYYKGVSFHRLLRNFMVQGGDPTGTGTGGESIWGKPFADEITSKYKHEGRGVLSMANSGVNSNGSQFFITFKSCSHLDGKHSIFGRVVGGFDTLSKIEKVATDSSDKPEEEITIIDAIVFSNPFENVDAEMEAEHQRDSNPTATHAEDSARKAAEDDQAWFSGSSAKPVVQRPGVGKYVVRAEPRGASIAEASVQDLVAAEAQDMLPPPPKKAKAAATGGFGNFSSW